MVQRGGRGRGWNGCADLVNPIFGGGEARGAEGGREWRGGGKLVADLHGDVAQQVESRPVWRWYVSRIVTSDSPGNERKRLGQRTDVNGFDAPKIPPY